MGGREGHRDSAALLQRRSVDRCRARRRAAPPPHLNVEAAVRHVYVERLHVPGPLPAAPPPKMIARGGVARRFTRTQELSLFAGRQAIMREGRTMAREGLAPPLASMRELGHSCTPS